MITASEARGIVALLDAGKLARAAWRAAAPQGVCPPGSPGNGPRVLSARNAAVALDLTTAKLVIVVWPEGEPFPRAGDPLVVLAHVGSRDRDRTAAAFSRGLAVPPSEEVVEEQVARASEAEGISWQAVEEQLASIFGASAA
jgi:hypothetical protein